MTALATQQKLSQSKRLSDVGTLVVIVAHELRNPLAAISLATQNIRRKKGDLPIEKHLDSIEKKVSESNKIIGDLLFCAKLKAPRYEIINIQNILSECIGLAKKKFQNPHIKVIRKFGQKKILVNADLLQINQLFANILYNAFESIIEKKGEITVGFGLNNQRNLEIYFKDNGVGMSKEDIRRTPELFFTTKAKGIGLGLTVCYEIVALHHGKISVKSQKNKGTTITIVLSKNGK